MNYFHKTWSIFQIKIINGHLDGREYTALEAGFNYLDSCVRSDEDCSPPDTHTCNCQVCSHTERWGHRAGDCAGTHPHLHTQNIGIIKLFLILTIDRHTSSSVHTNIGIIR